MTNSNKDMPVQAASFLRKTTLVLFSLLFHSELFSKVKSFSAAGETKIQQTCTNLHQSGLLLRELFYFILEPQI